MKRELPTGTLHVASTVAVLPTRQLRPQVQEFQQTHRSRLPGSHLKSQSSSHYVLRRWKQVQAHPDSGAGEVHRTSQCQRTQKLFKTIRHLLVGGPANAQGPSPLLGGGVRDNRVRGSPTPFSLPRAGQDMPHAPPSALAASETLG